MGKVLGSLVFIFCEPLRDLFVLYRILWPTGWVTKACLELMTLVSPPPEWQDTDVNGQRTLISRALVGVRVCA